MSNMPNTLELENKVETFVINVINEDYITPSTVVFTAIKALEEMPIKWSIDLQKRITRGLKAALTKLEGVLEHNSRLLKIYSTIPELENGFVSVKAMMGIGAVQKFETEHSCNALRKKIISNLKEIKKKLASPCSDEDTELCDSLLELINNIDEEELSWTDPIASQVLEDKTILEHLDYETKALFMEPVKRLNIELRQEVKTKCVKFIQEYKSKITRSVDNNYIHDGTWKESCSKQKSVVDDIFNVLKETWNNPAYQNLKALEKLNEGSYVSDVIIPILRATFNGVFNLNNVYFTAAEKESTSSKHRKCETNNQVSIGKKPDGIVALYEDGIVYEIVFAEYSRVICTSRKKNDDSIKIWRECNDSMTWICNQCNPQKNQFNIIGIQVAGTTIGITILLRDSNDLIRYFHLQEADIPLNLCNVDEIEKIIKLLLNLRNIVITNISLLNKALTYKDYHRNTKNITTVNSPVKKQTRPVKKIKK